MERFEFEELTFVRRRDCPDDELHPETRMEMTTARATYPELGHWSLTGLYLAACDYSQSVLAAGWAWHDNRDEGFLAFCWVRQRWPAFPFGSLGMYQCEVWDLGDKKPWEQMPQPPAPDWVARRLDKPAANTANINDITQKRKHS